METKNSPKLAEKFYCKKCNYKCSKESDYKKHLLTRKHNMETNGNKFVAKLAEHICECGKKYKTRSGYWKHKKNCIVDNKTSCDASDDPILELIKHVIKENKETQEILIKENKEAMVEMCKQIPTLQPNYNNSNNTNIFNIQMFLNEQCKDAINMSDFIKSIEISIDDMAKIGMQGQTEGMSSLLIDRLKEIDVLKRPVHCSDIKKETIFVKDENEWQEEEKHKPMLKYVLDNITKKTIEKLPDMCESEGFHELALEIVKDPREDKKIISKLAKEICVIDIDK